MNRPYSTQSRRLAATHGVGHCAYGRTGLQALWALLLMGCMACVGWVGHSHAAPPAKQPTLAPAQPTEKATLKAPGTLVYESASPAVVNIEVEGKGSDYFFGLIPYEATGTGSIISRDGFVITNAHVVEGATHIEVNLLNGDTYEATLVGTDEDHDIALIKLLDVERLLPVLPFADSDKLVIGQPVFAIGSPFGLKSSLSSGVVSSLHRRLDTEDGNLIENVIQTDAAINPGNSGGPLLNTQGQMVGINTAIFSPSGGSNGVGFAIPANTAKRIISDLKTHGRVIRPYLGVQVGHELQPSLARALNLSVSQGLLIKAVRKRSPAALAGVKGATRKANVNGQTVHTGGDVIMAVDNKPIINAAHFIDYIESRHVGDVVALKVLRQGKAKTLNITLTDKARFNKTAPLGPSLRRTNPR